MKIRDRLFVAICGISLGVGAATAQVIIRGGPPPAVIVERPGPPLHAGWVWVPGYYRWNGRRYVWVGGYWAEAAAASRDLDSWAVGSSRRGLCLGRRILALEHPQEPQISPLRYPGFPVKLHGIGAFHAPFFTEGRIRGLVQCSVAGNPGTLRSKNISTGGPLRCRSPLRCASVGMTLYCGRAKGE